MILVVHRSPLTGEVHGLELPITEVQIRAWLGGALIQHAFPHLTAPEREFIKTGFTRADWRLMFGLTALTGLACGLVLWLHPAPTPAIVASIADESSNTAPTPAIAAS